MKPSGAAREVGDGVAVAEEVLGADGEVLAGVEAGVAVTMEEGGAVEVFWAELGV